MGFIHLGIREFIDILVIFLIIFPIIRFLKTPWVPVVLTILLAYLVSFFFAHLLKLEVFASILRAAQGFSILALIIILQPEIRRLLLRFNLGALIGIKPSLEEDVLKEIVKAIKELKSQGLGALIVLERKMPLDGFIRDQGVSLEAKVNSQLIVSIFQKSSPLHDGALIIRGSKIIGAGIIIPISTSLPSVEIGTRHLAGYSLAELTDAVSIVLSEERGTISIIHDFNRVKIIDNPDRLLQDLTRILKYKNIRDYWKTQIMIKNALTNFKIFFGFKELPSFALAFLVSCLVWFHVYTERFFTTTIEVPVVIKDMPKNLVFINSPPKSLKVDVKGKGKNLLSIGITKPYYLLNVKNLTPGRWDFVISRNQFHNLEESIYEIVNIGIREFTVFVDELDSAKVPVAITELPVELGEELIVEFMKPEPESVTLYGPKRLLGKVEFVNTEVFHISQSTEDVFIVRNVPLVIPDENFSLNPNQVNIHISLVRLKRKTYKNVSVNVKNPQDKFFYDFNPKSATLIVKGPSRVIDTLDTSRMRLFINAPDFPGKFYVKITSELPHNFTVEKIIPDSVELVVRRRR